MGTDARVVDEDVDAAEPRGRLLHGGAYGGVVADVGLEAEQRFAYAFRIEVEYGDGRAPGRQRAGRGEPDTGRAARDEGPEAGQFGHATSSCAARSATQNVPSG